MHARIGSGARGKQVGVEMRVGVRGHIIRAAPIPPPRHNWTNDGGSESVVKKNCIELFLEILIMQTCNFLWCASKIVATMTFQLVINHRVGFAIAILPENRRDKKFHVRAIPRTHAKCKNILKVDMRCRISLYRNIWYVFYFGKSLFPNIKLKRR